MSRRVSQEHSAELLQQEQVSGRPSALKQALQARKLLLLWPQQVYGMMLPSHRERLLMSPQKAVWKQLLEPGPPRVRVNYLRFVWMFRSSRGIENSLHR